MTTDAIRRRGLSQVLSIVHVERRVSRAELTRATGLNRSTIGSLVAELGALGLVEESDPDASGAVGRPSPVVSAHPGVLAVAVNPEIDAVSTAVVDFAGRVERRARRRVDAVPDSDTVVQVVAEQLAELGVDGSRPVVGIGVAVPGLVRAEDSLVHLAPHLDWHDVALADALAARTGIPTVAANDARLGARAEATFGAGRGTRDLAYLNGGASGIGGGVLTAGVPLAGRTGYAGEIGHTLVRPGGRACSCGGVGHLEAEVRRELLLGALGLAEADDETLEQALTGTTDPRVRAEVERQSDLLAHALGTLVNVFDLELVVLGGSLSALLAASGDALAALVAERSLPRAEPVRLRPAELGADRLLVGAAELVYDGLLADPTLLQRPRGAQGARA